MRVKITTWTPDFDMTSIPDDVFYSENGRRNALKRQTFSGGSVWGHHVPGYARCRCENCIKKREVRDAKLAEQPKRPRGRPPTLVAEPGPKRPQGRPRTRPPVDPAAPKRPRGRPHKTIAASSIDNSRKGFDTQGRY